jgi:hypothetical protein
MGEVPQMNFLTLRESAQQPWHSDDSVVTTIHGSVVPLPQTGVDSPYCGAQATLRTCWLAVLDSRPPLIGARSDQLPPSGRFDQ